MTLGGLLFESTSLAISFANNIFNEVAFDFLPEELSLVASFSSTGLVHSFNTEMVRWTGNPSPRA
uniref:Uncharacterized protein n=1 Tax=Arundo donax TaxID=35708 RepID=A0A0A9GUR8_ARUDO